VVDTPSVTVDAERVSSSRIRDALGNADFELAEQLLGRPYAMDGKVCYGRQLGRTLGVPTANVELHRIKAPMAGVYAVEVAGVGTKLYHGVANVGIRPTVGDRSKAILEVHLFDFEGDLYGKSISVRFRHKIRDERKFDSLDELEKNIRADIQASRHWFGLDPTNSTSNKHR
jgi:riboflavin kinase/FMN adenylyltransferase